VAEFYNTLTGQITGLPQFLRADPNAPLRTQGAAPEQPSAIGGGLRAGWNEMQGMLGNAVGAVGAAADMPGMRDWGTSVGAKNMAEAQQYGRPDLEVAPWEDGGAPVLPWLGYQTAKQVPQIAAALGLTAAAGLASPVTVPAAGAAGIAATAARIGAAVPSVLGGGGLRAGATEAAKQLALKQGANFARTLAAAEVTGIPLAIGSMYGEAVDRGDATREDAFKAIGLSPAYAALDALQPAQLKGLMQGGSPGKAVKRVLFAGIAGAAIEMPGEAAQTAMELSFRPDLSTAEKADQIVKAALTGGAVGGTLGGFGGIRRAVDPNAISNEEILAATDPTNVGEPAPLQSPRGEVYGLDQRPNPAADPQLPGVAPAPVAPNRPFAGADAQQLVTDLSTIENRMRSGQATQADAEARRALQSELAARQGETAGPLAQADTQSLVKGLQAIQRKAEAATPEEVQLGQALSAELQRRQTAAPETADGGLFGNELPQSRRYEQPVAPPPDPRVVAVEQTREKAAQLAGGRNKFIESLDATNDVEMAAAVVDRLEQGDGSTRVMRLAERLGILNAEGQTRDFATEIPAAEQRAEAMWAKVRETGTGEKQASEFSRKVAQLKSQQALVEQATALRAEKARQTAFAEAPVGAQTDMLGLPPAPLAPAAPAPVEAPQAPASDPNQLPLDFNRVMPREELEAVAQQVAQTAPVGPLGEQLLARLQQGRKEQDTASAEDQLLEARYRQMQEALIAQEQSGDDQASLFPQPAPPAPAPRPRPEITPTDYQKQPRLPTLGRMPLQPSPAVAPEPTPVAETPDPNQIGMDFNQPFATQALAQAARQQARGEVGSQLAPQLQALAERDTQAKASARRRAEFDAAENQRLDQRTKQAIAADIGPGGLDDDLPSEPPPKIEIKRVGQGGRKGGERTTIRNRYREADAPRQVLIVHGGADFEAVNLGFSGTGEPGNIRPLGKGLYGFLVDVNDGNAARDAIAYAKHYATKYGRGQKTVHVFKLSTEADVSSNGPMPSPFEMTGQRAEQSAAWKRDVGALFDAVQQLPAGEERQRAARAAQDAHREFLANDKTPKFGQIAVEQLPIGLVEISVSDPSLLTRVDKFPADMDATDMLQAVLAKSARGVSKAEVEADIALVTEGWKGGINVRVVDSVDEMPADVRASVREDAMEGAYGFVAKNGDVYVIAGNLSSRAMGVATVFHETLGHLGLASQLRGRLDRTMLDMHRSSKLLQLETKAWRDANPDAYKNDPNPLARAVEEVLARRSERGPIDAKTWDKLVAIVKDFARQMGIKLNFSDAEITAVLAMAHSRAMKGQLTEKTLGGNRYLYIGKKATLDRVRSFRLAQAQAMDGLGADPETTRKATGWFKGPDGEWRQEIADKYAMVTTAFRQLPFLNPNEGNSVASERLEDAMEHPEFFAAYPDARDITVVRRKALGDYDYDGSFNEVTNTITITDSANDEIGTLLHELQHWVQMREGFALGGNPYAAVDMLNDADLATVVAEIIAPMEAELADMTAVADMAATLLRAPELAQMQQMVRDVAGDRDKTKWFQMRDDVLKMVFPDTPASGTTNPARLNAANRLAKALRADGMDLQLLAAEYKSDAEDLQFIIDKARSGDRDIVKAQLNAVERHKIYERLMGEIESRDVERRRTMNAAQREMREPYRADSALSGGRTPLVVTQRDMQSRGVWSASMESRVSEAGKVGEAALKKLQSTSLRSLTPTTRAAELYMSTLGHIVERYGPIFGTKQNNPLQKFYDAHQTRVALEQRWAQLSLKPYYQYEQLMAKDKKLTEDLNWIMGLTQFAIDPRKGWDHHEWLHGSKDADVMRGHVAKANAIYSRLRQKGVADVYEDFVAVNEATHYAQQTMAMHNLANADPAIASRIASAKNSPMLEFMRTSSLHESPKKAREFWKGKVDQLNREVLDFSKAQRGRENMTDAEFTALENRTQSLVSRAKKTMQQHVAMERAPYFHLGRFGDYFVSFDIRSLPDGAGTRVDQSAVAEIAKVLEANGIRGVTMNEGTQKPNVFIRVGTEQEARNLRDIAVKMQQAGLLSAKEIKMDKRNTINAAAGGDALISQLIQNIEATIQIDPAAPEAEQAATAAFKAQMLAQVRDFYLDQLPDMSIAKVMVHRESVPGFTSDMVRSYAFRTQVGAHALSGLTSSAMLGGAVAEMKTVANQTRKGAGSDDIFAQRDVLTEIMTREGNRAKDTGHGFVDRLRAWNHAYFLGMSPAYALTNLTQLPVLLWPELAKRHGFAKSFKEIVKVTPMALRIIKATIAAGVGMGARRAADATISEASLKAAGLSERDATFVMKIVNTGTIDIGSASRENGRVVEDRVTSREDLVLRYAGAFGFYTEMTTRLIAALSARNLANEDPQMKSWDPERRHAYAVEVVNQSMLNYSSYNVGRAFGNQGVAGRSTRVATSFLQYSFQLIEKLVREINTGFMDSAADASERTAARRFLGAHMVAITALAGSLGLPGATVLARAVEALVDILGDDEEPFDAKASYRNFLADVFGQDMAEVLARGAPRALMNIDMSGRVGEADIIPFSRLLADRREWKEALNEWAFRTLGSPFSMGRNILNGGNEIAKGNLLAGMKEIVPVALKGPTEAYKMSQKGYTDRAGNTLPMSVGANDILAQLLGFNPSEKAEYTEANLAQDQRKGISVRDASNIRQNLASAIESGDREKARKWLKKARDFDADNPGYAVLPNISRVLQQRAKARNMGTTTGLPLGTNMRDPGAADLTRYANF
jgi:hypothetical protein